jgi:hypothetical protein
MHKNKKASTLSAFFLCPLSLAYKSLAPTRVGAEWMKTGKHLGARIPPDVPCDAAFSSYFTAPFLRSRTRHRPQTHRHLPQNYIRVPNIYVSPRERRFCVLCRLGVVPLGRALAFGPWSWSSGPFLMASRSLGSLFCFLRTSVPVSETLFRRVSLLDACGVRD